MSASLNLDRLKGSENLSGIVINISDYCNIHCTYCFEAKDEGVLTRRKDSPEVLRRILEAIEQSGSEVFTVSFYGGEPLVQIKEIEKIVLFLKKYASKRLKFTIATNGILLKGAREDFLRENNFGIQVSIDGPPEVIDIHRRKKNGSGSSAALAHLASRVPSFPDIMARPTITPETCGSFDRILAHLLEIGFNVPERPIKFDFDLTDSWSEEAFETLECAAEAATEMLLDHYSAGGRARILPLDRIFSLWRPRTSREGKGGYCGAGCSMVHVNAKGSWYPCSRLTPSHDPNFGKLRLDALSDRDEIKKIIHPGIKRKPACETCNARHFCEQTCPARIHAGSGQFDRVSDKQCRLIRITHKMARSVLVQQLLAASPGFQEAYGT